MKRRRRLHNNLTLLRHYHLLLLHVLLLPAASCFPQFRRTPRLIVPPWKKNTNVVSSSTGAAAERKTRQQQPLVLSRRWARILYCISSVNPLIAVIFNDYSKMLEPLPLLQTQRHHSNIIAQTVGGLFVFARLNPRVTFSVGAVLRALQCSTAFQYVIDPSAGVGFGLNALCLFAKSRWPATIFLGWSMTKSCWIMLGATAPPTSPVPITVQFPKKIGPNDSNNNNPADKGGYRMGL